MDIANELDVIVAPVGIAWQNAPLKAGFLMIY
jgi:hypothetical protein